MITYKAEILENVENRPGTWNSIRVAVFRCEGEKREQVGAFVRNYPSLFRTFCHFTRNGQDFALYSPDYTSTRIMELPSCKDIGGEEPNDAGFCPVDFFVPRYIMRELIGLDDKPSRVRVNEPSDENLQPGIYKFTPLDPNTGKRVAVEKPHYPVSPLLHYPFGFVAGCIWGDDSSWKIQYLDLSEAEKGRIKREQRFGYIALPNSMNLSQAIRMQSYDPERSEEWGHHITINVQQQFDLRTGKVIDPLD